MKRKPIIQLDQVLREDQLAHLAERAISGGLAEANRREQGYREGKRRRKRRAPAPIATILEDLGITLPAAARRLFKEEIATRQVRKKPPSTSSLSPRSKLEK